MIRVEVRDVPELEGHPPTHTLFEAGFFVAADFDVSLALEAGFLDAGLAFVADEAFALGLAAAGFLASPVTV